MGIAPLWRELGLGHAFVEDFFSALIGYAPVAHHVSRLVVLGCHAARAGDTVAGQDQPGEPPVEAPEQRTVAQPVGHHLIGERHGEHPVGNHARQARGAGKGLVKVYRVPVARGLRVLTDLFDRHALGQRGQGLPGADLLEVQRTHGLHAFRMMTRALPSETGRSAASLAFSSNVTSSMSPRELIAVSRPVVRIRSPGRTGRLKLKHSSPWTMSSTTRANS